MTGDYLQHDRRILRGMGETADLIEGRRIGDEALARHAAVRWFDSRDTAETRGLANRSTRVTPERGLRNARCHRSRTAAR